MADSFWFFTVAGSVLVVLLSAAWILFRRRMSTDNASHHVLPRDEHGYTQSFAADDVKGYVAFFQRWGVVVIRDALSQEDVHRTKEEIWAHPDLQASCLCADLCRFAIKRECL